MLRQDNTAIQRMTMFRGHLKAVIPVALCLNVILWQASESATIGPTPDFETIPSANPCDQISCEPPRFCQLDGQTNQPECVCPRFCNKIYKPVCGSNGKTYGNECQLRVDACETNTTITEVYNGTCQEMICSGVECEADKECVVDDEGHPKCVCNIMCTMDVDPVCGSDGVTYSNECQLNVAACESGTNITMVHRGQCEQTNPCENVTCAAPRRCELDEQTNQPVCVCPTMCPAVYIPVCGSNGKTYGNACELGVDACESNTNITKVYDGTCEERNLCANVTCPYGGYCKVDENNRTKCFCDFLCFEVYDPVCGSDGKTYSNECEMNRASCNSGDNITVAYEGECGQGTNPCAAMLCLSGTYCVVDEKNQASCVCNEQCTSKDHPVCGSDGKTYRNECELLRQRCQHDRDLTVVCYGVCDERGKSRKLRCRSGDIY